MTRRLITLADLRWAATYARLLDQFLDDCNAQDVFGGKGAFLMGFDLGWLADRFDEAATKMEIPNGE